MQCDHIKALDLAGNGDWDEAHKIVQQYSDKLSCLIHAYLHRLDAYRDVGGRVESGIETEGDISNAQYWYHRADDDSMDGGGRAKQEARAEEMPNNNLDERLHGCRW